MTASVNGKTCGKKLSTQVLRKLAKENAPKIVFNCKKALKGDVVKVFAKGKKKRCADFSGMSVISRKNVSETQQPETTTKEGKKITTQSTTTTQRAVSTTRKTTTATTRTTMTTKKLVATTANPARANCKQLKNKENESGLVIRAGTKST